MISHEGRQWGGHNLPDSPLYLETRYFRSFWAIWSQSAQKIEKMLRALTLNVAVSSMPCAENIYWSKNDLKLPFLQQVALLPLSTHGGVSDSWSSQRWRRRSCLICKILNDYSVEQKTVWEVATAPAAAGTLFFCTAQSLVTDQKAGKCEIWYSPPSHYSLRTLDGLQEMERN